MADKCGIFIRSDKDAELIIKGCKELLKTVNSDISCIKSLRAEDDPKGFEIHFKNNSVLVPFLKQRYLPLTEEMATIHALTTKLAVHDIFPDSEDYLIEELRLQLEKLGEIISISNIPVTKEYPTIQSGDWLVEINMPEVLENDIFKSCGLPNRMHIQLPSKSDPPAVKRVTFFCSLCESREHHRELCSNLVDGSNDKLKNCPQSECEFVSSPLTSRNVPNFEIVDRIQMNTSTPNSKSAKQKHRIEAIASGLEKKKSRTQSTLQNYYIRKSTEIKQELEDESYKTPSKPLKRSLNEDDRNSAKKFCFATILENEQDKPEDYSTASSTTGQESPQVVYDSSASTPEVPKESESILKVSGVFSYHDDSNVPNLPTSSQPENIFENSANNSTIQETSDYSDSNDTPKQRKGTRKKPIYAPVVLPDRIKQIVLERGRKENELTIGQLEAFFNHVKKKMSPAKIARQFTRDVHCLHEQLKEIVQQYYMTPKAGSGEDSRFMKWLEGMLERFDSVPSKRKKIKSERRF